MSIYPPVRDEMIRLMSVTRLQTYGDACGGDVKAALALYQWNLELAAALFTSIHYFELALRNTIDTQLQAGLGTDSNAWFDERTDLLAPGTIQKINQAKRRITDAAKAPTHGRIVAELELGFWWTLLSDQYNRTLWPVARNGFGSVRRQRLHGEIDNIRRLRNRIAHHEPLFHRDIVDDYTRLLSTAERIHPHLAWWIDATSTVSSVLDRRP